MDILEPQSSKEAFFQIIGALKYLKRGSSEENELLNWLYTPDPRIGDHLLKLKDFLNLQKPSQGEKKAAGYLLEQILFLAFRGLAGYSKVLSYESSSHQYDLLVSGDNEEWEIVCDRLYLKSLGDTYARSILVEAKAIGKTVSTAQFSRLCSILSLDLFNTVNLGVFFTLKGASGFPKKNQDPLKCIRRARLCQVLLNARLNKKIVVLDQDDVFQLDKNGSLIRILIDKIEELEFLRGVDQVTCNEPVIASLPSYLQELN